MLVAAGKPHLQLMQLFDCVECICTGRSKYVLFCTNKTIDGICCNFVACDLHKHIMYNILCIIPTVKLFVNNYSEALHTAYF